MTVVTRFAPSPTGLLHLGHVRAALAAWGPARAAGGRFLLRIEDIDQARARPAFAGAILQDLDWLGLHWDGPVRVQSAHLADYRAVLAQLDDRGLVYPCICSRADLAAAGGAPQGPEGPAYPGHCRNPTSGARAARLALPHAWRLDMARALASLAAPLAFHEAGRGTLRCDPARFGDVVLGRRDAAASYHLCVCHDDALQGITLVTRGEDLLPATELHCLLQDLMGWPRPSYAHHPLLTDASGRRLAKRDGAMAVATLREAGHSPEEVRAMAR